MSGVVKWLISPIGALIGGMKPKAPKQMMPLPTITPRSNSAVSDALLRRRGAAANQRTGGLGAESSAAPKKQLMGQ